VALKIKRPRASPHASPNAIRFGVAESLRGVSALHASAEYERQIRLTSAGRRSDDMRKEGHRFAGLGAYDRAHEFFTKAAAQHAPADNSAAAAACWYDLGLSFKDISAGVRRQNLLEAARLMRLAEESTERRTDVRRYILTLDGLGQVLRAVAAEFPSAHEVRSEALKHLKKSVSLARDHGFATVDLLANALINLGNALDQSGRLDEAIAAHEEALAVAEWIELKAPVWKESMTRGLRLPLRRANLAGTLLRRGRDSDLQRALKIVRAVEQEGDPEFASRASLIGYLTSIRLGGAAGTGARLFLKRINARLLTPDERRTFLRAISDDGEGERAIAIARRGISDALNERRGTKANADADRCAAEAQQFSRLAAELLIEAGRTIDAFLVLESTAALRYFDAVTAFHWAPSTPLLSRLHHLRGQASDLAALLDDVALRIAGVEPSQDGHVLDSIFDGVLQHVRERRALETSWAGSIDEIEHLFGRARASGVPGQVLREHANRISNIIESLDEEMWKLEPTSLASAQQWSTPAREEVLDELFADHPGCVLVRLDADAERLLAISVWKSGPELAAASIRLSIGPATIRALSSLLTEPPPAAHERQRAQMALADFLSSADLSPILPDRNSHVILLPSLVASLVPWAAVGPPGRTLLDLADAVSYLPNLTPMLMRQAQSVTRSHAVVLTPGGASGAAQTMFHEVAFSDDMPNEMRLRGAAATIDSARRHIASADVVSFFAHGSYGSDASGSLRLADGDFDPLEHMPLWREMERVELWACRSGVNLSYDPLTPRVDEAFGLDATLHHLGVRSTIGTYWNVPDLVTALLVREYRRSLSRGRSPAAALADAQRWWRVEGLEHARAALDSDSPHRHFLKFASSLGLESEDANAVVTSVLGPVNSRGRLSNEEVEALIRDWSSATAWAGFRFMGVSGRRPRPPESVEEPRDLTAAEQDMIQEILEGGVESRDPDDEFEAALAAATSVSAVSPSPNEAIAAARLYATRRRSAAAHNLVRALAWIHEALAAPNLDNADRRRLEREAAWLWLDVASDELTPIARLLQLRSAHPLLRARTEVAANLLPDGVERSLILAALDLLPDADDAATIDVVRAWEQIRRESPSSVDSLRLRALFVSLLPMLDRESGARIAVDLVADYRRSDPDDIAAERWHARYAITLAWFIVRSDLTGLPALDTPPAYLLPHSLFLDRFLLVDRSIAAADRVPDGIPTDIASQDLTLLEHDFWGSRRDDGVAAWISTGSPGTGWRRFAGVLLRSNLESTRGESSGARHFIASVHLGLDLRMIPLAANAVLQGKLWRAHRPVDLSMIVRARERHLAVLFDGAANGVTAPASDVFRRSRREADAVSKTGANDVTSWLIAITIDAWNMDGIEHPESRTGAFDVERRLLTFDKVINHGARDQAQRLLEIRSAANGSPAADLVEAALGPSRDFERLEASLAELPSNVAVLGAIEGANGELLLAVTWTEDGQVRQAVHVSRNGLAIELRVCWDELQRIAVVESADPERAESGSRARKWRELRSLLDITLCELLRDVGSRRLQVLAAHELRGIPWLGLTADGIPLYRSFPGIAQLPFLGFDSLGAFREQSNVQRTVCVFGGPNSVAQFEFGKSAIATLRKLISDTEGVEPTRPVGTRISEVERIESVDNQIAVLRFYGVASTLTENLSTEGLSLAFDRTLMLRNLDGMKLPACECVEIWAATEDVGALARQSIGCDSLPTLVRGFLAAGAGGVVDMAWEVHDVVKALVCEQFGLIRRAPKAPAEALCDAVSQTGDLLAEWASVGHSFRSVDEALAWIDRRRRDFVRRLGLDSELVSPFSGGARLLGVGVDQLITTCCQPSQLAAFRWWGA
jgi:tetratricopeptide (TPR) repeat protein